MRSSAVSQVHSVTWAWEPGRVLYRATGEPSISTACQLALPPFYRAESSDGELRPTPSAPYLPVFLEQAMRDDDDEFEQQEQQQTAWWHCGSWLVRGWPWIWPVMSVLGGFIWLFINSN